MVTWRVQKTFELSLHGHILEGDQIYRLMMIVMLSMNSDQTIRPWNLLAQKESRVSPTENPTFIGCPDKCGVWQLGTRLARVGLWNNNDKDLKEDVFDYKKITDGV